MPHIIVKLWPNKKEEEKQLLADKIVKAVMESLEVPETSISVAMEEIPRENWAKEVYIPDIINKADNIYVKPGYVPTELKNKDITS